jgi:hypothetical protein
MEALTVALKLCHIKVNSDMEYEMMFSWLAYDTFVVNMSFSVVIIGKLLSLLFVIQLIS